MGKALTLCSEKNLKSQVPWKEEINNQPHLVLALLSELTRQLFWLAQERSTGLCCFLGQNPCTWVPKEPSWGFALVQGCLGAAPRAGGPKGAPGCPGATVVLLSCFSGEKRSGLDSSSQFLLNSESIVHQVARDVINQKTGVEEQEVIAPQPACSSPGVAAHGARGLPLSCQQTTACGHYKSQLLLVIFLSVWLQTCGKILYCVSSTSEERM